MWCEDVDTYYERGRLRPEGVRVNSTCTLRGALGALSGAERRRGRIRTWEAARGPATLAIAPQMPPQVLQQDVAS